MPMFIEVLDDNLNIDLATNCNTFEITSNSHNSSNSGIYVEFNTIEGSEVFKSTIQHLNDRDMGCNLILTSPNLNKKVLVCGATFHHETINNSFSHTYIETLRYSRYTVVPSNLTLAHIREVFHSMLFMNSENNNYVSESFKTILSKALEEI